MTDHVWVIEATDGKGGWYPCWPEHRTTKRSALKLLRESGWQTMRLRGDDGRLVRYRVARYERVKPTRKRAPRKRKP